MRTLLTLVLTVVSTIAHSALITEQHYITSSGEGSVGYTYFEVTSAGNFDIYTMGPTIDPKLYLFKDDGSLELSDYIAENDDGCPEAICGPAGSFSNSILDEIYLDIGFYVAAISDFSFSTDEVVSGRNNNDLIGFASIVVDVGSSDTSGANAQSSKPIPEPGSLAMMLLPLAAFGAVKRKRQA